MVARVAVFIILFNIFCSVSSNVATEVLVKADEAPVAECGIYLAPASNPEHGRGLVAGKFIRENEHLYSSVVLTIDFNNLESTQLINYVFCSVEDGVAIAQLGLDMSYNHKESATITRMWAPGERPMFEDQVLAHATHTEVLIETKKNVSGQ